jgi:quercetin dioxygenase-like cupin family protein
MACRVLVATPVALGGVMLAALCIAQPASAPAAPSVTSRPILVSPTTLDDKMEFVLIAVSIGLGGAVSMHTHPGDCIGSVLEGTVELLVEGQTPRRVAAGEAYANLRGTVHGLRNVGEGSARLLNNLLVDKGAARVQPAAASRP